MKALPGPGRSWEKWITSLYRAHFKKRNLFSNWYRNFLGAPVGSCYENRARNWKTFGGHSSVTSAVDVKSCTNWIHVEAISSPRRIMSFWRIRLDHNSLPNPEENWRNASLRFSFAIWSAVWSCARTVERDAHALDFWDDVKALSTICYFYLRTGDKRNCTT